MPRTCTICIHPDRLLIDRALVVGTPMSELSWMRDASPDAMQRHRMRHLAPEVTAAIVAEVECAGQARKLAAQVRRECQGVLDALRRIKDGDTHELLTESRLAGDRLKRLDRPLADLQEGLARLEDLASGAGLPAGGMTDEEYSKLDLSDLGL